MTDLSLSGIVSLPWSPLASLPPDVEVPLPLLFGAMPVVSLGLFELAEFAAGRGVPGPPASLWAYASGPDIKNAAVKAIAVIFMAEQASTGVTVAQPKTPPLVPWRLSRPSGKVARAFRGRKGRTGATKANSAARCGAAVPLGHHP